MGLHQVVLPELKLSGEEYVQEFLWDFEMYVMVNEWSDQKAGQYLAVFLKDDTKAFFHQQSETVKKSFSEFSNYPYLPPKEPIVNTVHRGKAVRKKSYYVDRTVNKEKAIFLVDTGAEVSLISSSTPGLVINDSQVSPVSITHQPITACGEVEVRLELGGAQTKWNFLVVDDLRDSVLGADFIESHHESSWGICNGAL